MATSEGIPSSIDIEFLELNDNPYYMIATHHLIIERADGEESGSICIPHYKQKWFE